MIRPILCAVSALALLTSPVMAAENNAHTGMTEANMREEATRMEHKAEGAMDKAGAKIENAYETIKAKMITDEAKTASGKTVTIDKRRTANGMIGEPVLNTKNERVGTVEDIIVDGAGKAMLIIVADGGPLSMGDKKAAFDYGLITSRNADGDVIMPLTEANIEKVAEFSYDRKDAGDNKTRVIPQGGYSVKELLDADLLNSASKEVGDVENIVFRNGAADQLVVSYDETLKTDPVMVLNYSSVKLVPAGDDEVDYQLSANQSAQLEAARKN